MWMMILEERTHRGTTSHSDFSFCATSRFYYRFYPASHYDFHSQLPTSLSTFCRPFILSDALPLDYEVLQMAFIAYLQEFFGKFKKYQPISCVVIISLQPVLACFTDSDRVKPGPKIRYLGLARKIKGTLK